MIVPAVTRSNTARIALPKARTGILGLDEITGGGIPEGRPTLVCGNAGCGKTLLAMQFLVNGATLYDEPGVFMAFEETAEDLAANVRSLGFHVGDLVAKKKLAIDYVFVERSEIEETGEYDLEGLFIRLGHAIDSIGARRVVLDTLETLFGGLSNTAILRSELRRLFRWLRERGVTAIITGERGEGALTRHGLEEYISDCVILLDHRVIGQVATRRLRVVKYRGTSHGTNEYPFLIDENGIDVMPITSLGLEHRVSSERISTGVAGLDEMLGGLGVFRGSSVLVSGSAGTGKTSLAAYFADAACRRGERSLFFAFEESVPQLVRNMRAIGLDLMPWIDAGKLRVHSARPTLQGLEAHLATMHRMLREFDPQVVVIDPLTNFITLESFDEVKTMLLRLIDLLKERGITALYTSLNHEDGLESSDEGLSSLIDTWLLMRNLESNGERNRGLFVLKSRGMAHSNQVREFQLTDHGVELHDVPLGPEGMVMGSARVALQSQEQERVVSLEQDLARRRRDLERHRRTLEAQMEALRLEFEGRVSEMEMEDDEAKANETGSERGRAAMAASRTQPARPNGKGQAAPAARSAKRRRDG
jgi:circadian clock protein KaiC